MQTAPHRECPLAPWASHPGARPDATLVGIRTIVTRLCREQGLLWTPCSREFEAEPNFYYHLVIGVLQAWDYC